MSLNEGDRFVAGADRRHPLKLRPKNTLKLDKFKKPH